MAIPWSNPLFWLATLGFTLLTGVIAGSYPAFYLSGFKPIRVLKGIFKAGRFASLPRKVLIVVQFTTSIALLIGTIVVFRQVSYAKDRPVGYTREGLITVALNTPELQQHYDALRHDQLQTGAVTSVAGSSQATTYFSDNTSLDWEGKDPDLVVFFRNITVTTDFGKTIGWQIRQGRDFSPVLPTDSQAMILNEAAVRTIGLKTPVGSTIRWHGQPYTVIGVANDMVTQSPYDPVDGAFFVLPGWRSLMTIRVHPALPMREALAKIEPVFRKYNPESPFQYRFADEEYAKKFSDEEKIGRLSTVFAILATFISCLGLFGLSAFVAEQRSKEIGIRKVLGASVFHLWRLLSRDFVVLVVIALFITAPAAWYFMRSWLLRYQYHTEIPWWVFAVVGLGALGITLLTVSCQTVRTALINPVKSLRSE